MTDQETRYRCPGCGNEESGALIEAVKDRPTGSGNVICPSFRCFSYAKYYLLIEEPEPEGAREWGYNHRFPGGNWPTACGVEDGPGRTYAGNLFAEAQSDPCPACLPKPGEGEEGISREALKAEDAGLDKVIELAVITYSNWFWLCKEPQDPRPEMAKAVAAIMRGIDVWVHKETELQAMESFGKQIERSKERMAELEEKYRAPTDDPPPPRADWVPPEWNQDDSYPGYLERVFADLAEHVNAMLARPTEGGEREVALAGLRRAAEGEMSEDLRYVLENEIRILSGDNVFAQAMRNDRDRKADEEPEAPWTSVEDGLPGDEEDVEVRMTAWRSGSGTWWGHRPGGGYVDENHVSVRHVTHWRPKPEEG